MLLNGRKFDFRFFLLIASLEPFTAFIYREGVARFCAQDYVVPSKQNLDRPCAHLTKTAINKENVADPDELTRLASHVLAEVVTGRPASRTWDEVCQASQMTLLGFFAAIIAALPQNGGAQLRARLITADGPRITVPRPVRTGLCRAGAREYRFIGALTQNPVTERKRVRRVAPLESLSGSRPGGDGAPLEAVVGHGDTRRDATGTVAAPTVAAHPPTESRRGTMENDGEAVPRRKLTDARRLWHILGIDIILDSRGHPKVLELNDRPSLQVTASFEQNLKEGLIREAFMHLALDGTAFGETVGSRWQQILPVPEGSVLADPVRAMMQRKSELQCKRRADAGTSYVQRTMAAEIKPGAYRSRFCGRGLLIDGKEDIM